jgi:hypothetical protein
MGRSYLSIHLPVSSQKLINGLQCNLVLGVYIKSCQVNFILVHMVLIIIFIV